MLRVVFAEYSNSQAFLFFWVKNLQAMGLGTADHTDHILRLTTSIKKVKFNVRWIFISEYLFLNPP